MKRIASLLLGLAMAAAALSGCGAQGRETVSYTHLLTGCKVEPSMADAAAPASFQFMRLGYFCLDSKDSRPDHLVFNRSVSLKDSFKK